MLSRRELIGKAAVGAGAALTVGAAWKGTASARTGHDAMGDPASAPAARDDAAAGKDVVSGPPPWALLKPLAAGAALAHGWSVVELGPVQDGASVVTIRNGRGRAHRIHLCRNDGKPQGIIHTRGIDLVVMNEGHGDLPTEEGLAQAVAALAHAVAANEAGADLAALLPHAERMRRFASADGPSMDGKLR